MENFADRYPTVESFVEDITTRYPDIKYGVDWRTGGREGGSCWGSSADYEVEAEPEPETEHLDDILDDVAPGLRYSQFRALMQANIVVIHRGTNMEYYGNYTTYATKKIDLEALWQALREL